MYAWIWRKLPFGLWGKLTGSIALATATLALLWYVIFPWATPLLPFDDVQVGADDQQGPAQEDPNAVVSGAPTSSTGTGSTGTGSTDTGPTSIPYSTLSNAPDLSGSATPKSSKSSSTVVLPGG